MLTTTASALLAGTHTQSMSARAVLQRTQLKITSADLVVALRVFPHAAATSVLLKTITGTTAADARLIIRPPRVATAKPRMRISLIRVRP